MDQFTERDREHLGKVMALLEAMERNQRLSLKRIRRLPDLTATAMVQAIGKRALFLIGVGIAIGSALGGAGIELAKSLIAGAWGH